MDVNRSGQIQKKKKRFHVDPFTDQIETFDIRQRITSDIYLFRRRSKT